MLQRQIHEKAHPASPCRVGLSSFSKSNRPGLLRQNRPDFRQHFLNRLPEPHGQRSFLPSFSVSSLSPWTIRTPRLTWVSDGNPRRRLLIGSKKMAGRGSCVWDTSFQDDGAGAVSNHPCKRVTYFRMASILAVDT